jgi:hypothetical protein
MIRDRPVDVATAYGVDGRSSIPGRVRDFSLLHNVQTGFGAHPASYLMGPGEFLFGGKAVGA